MTRPFDLIMFDLDGTLIETAPEIADAVNDTLRHFNLPAVTQQQVNDWIGHGTRTLLIQALAFVGKLLNVPPSICSSPPSSTGGKAPGIDTLARIERARWPRLCTASRAVE